MNAKEINNYSQSEQNYLDKILKQFSDVFRNEPGRIRNYECKIKLKKKHTGMYKAIPNTSRKTRFY